MAHPHHARVAGTLHLRAVQAMEVLQGAFEWLQRASLDCAVTAPLVRLVAFLALKRRLRPPAAGTTSGKTGGDGDGRADITWLDAVYMSCQSHIIEFLECLAEAPTGAAASSTSCVDGHTHPATLSPTSRQIRVQTACMRLCYKVVDAPHALYAQMFPRVLAGGPEVAPLPHRHGSNGSVPLFSWCE